MPPQQRLRNCAGRVWPKYRYVARAAVGLKGFGRRQVAFVGPPEAVLFCELPALFYLHGHRLQSSSASRFTFVRLLGGAAAAPRRTSAIQFVPRADHSVSIGLMALRAPCWAAK